MEDGLDGVDQLHGPLNLSSSISWIFLHRDHLQNLMHFSPRDNVSESRQRI